MTYNVNNTDAHINNQYNIGNQNVYSGLSKEQINKINLLVDKLLSNPLDKHEEIIENYQNELSDLSYATFQMLFSKKEASSRESIIYIVSNYVSLKQELNTFALEAPELIYFTNEAKLSLEAGNFVNAREIYENAKKALCENNINYEKKKADLSVLSAQTSLLIYDYESAIEAYDEAYFAVKSIDAYLSTQYLFSKAGILCKYGQQVGRKSLLEDSIKIYEKIEKIYPNIKSTYVADWARIQGSISNCYRILNRMESNFNTLQKALNFLEKASEHLTKETYPFDWALNQNGFGNIYQELSNYSNTSKNLKQASAYYKNALTILENKAYYFQCGGIYYNLGETSRMLSQRERDIEIANEAIFYYKNSLRQWTHPEFPKEWAMLQCGLGSAYGILGEITGQIYKLKKGIMYHKKASREYTKERFPIDWAMIQGNIGATYGLISKLNNQIDCHEHIEIFYNNALEIYNEKNYFIDAARIYSNFGNLYKEIGNRNSDIRFLEKSIIKYEEAAKNYKYCNNIFELAQTQAFIGSVYSIIGDITFTKNNHEIAIKYINDAIKTIENDSDSYWTNKMEQALIAIKNKITTLNMLDNMIKSGVSGKITL